VSLLYDFEYNLHNFLRVCIRFSIFEVCQFARKFLSHHLRDTKIAFKHYRRDKRKGIVETLLYYTNDIVCEYYTARNRPKLSRDEKYVSEQRGEVISAELGLAA